MIFIDKYSEQDAKPTLPLVDHISNYTIELKWMKIVSIHPLCSAVGVGALGLVVVCSVAGVRHGGLRSCNMWCFSILDDIKNYPTSPPRFSKPFSVSSWTMKHSQWNLALVGTENCNPLYCCNQKRVLSFLLITSQHGNDIDVTCDYFV